jgi:hypothetical protein
MAHLPEGYQETFADGMISYVVPLEVYPDTYNRRPLLYAGLASHQSYMTLYLMGVYGSAASRVRFETEYRATGRRLDMGKSCVHFRKLDDLPLEVVGRAIASLPMGDYVAMAKAARAHRSG